MCNMVLHWHEFPLLPLFATPALKEVLREVGYHRFSRPLCLSALLECFGERSPKGLCRVFLNSSFHTTKEESDFLEEASQLL